MSDPFAYKRDAKLQARLSAEVEALARKPENSTCADCGETKRIRFCSVTLGVFLCNRCYGLHRALGAHVTRGKCLGLDAWKPEEVQLLREVGNARARAMYEARAAEAGVRPPAPSAADREVAVWIRDKYERKRFFNPGAVNSSAATKLLAVTPPPVNAPAVSDSSATKAAAQSAPSHSQLRAAPPVVDDLLGDLFIQESPPPPCSHGAQPAASVLPPAAPSPRGGVSLLDDLLSLDISAGQSGQASQTVAAPLAPLLPPALPTGMLPSTPFGLGQPQTASTTGSACGQGAMGSGGSVPALAPTWAMASVTSIS